MARHRRMGTLLLILLLAAALRIIHIDLLSLWIDEGFTWNLTQYGDALHILRQDVHPPLYFYAVDAWVALTGTSRVALRYFSVLPSLLSVAVIYQLARELERHRGINSGGVVPCMAALLLALADAEIFLAQEARSYTWHVLFACLSMWGFLRWWRTSQWGDAWLWWLSTVALVYTFYLGAFVGVVQGIIVLITPTRHARYINRQRALSLGILIAAAVMLLPWIGYTLPEQSGNLSMAEWIRLDAFAFWADDFATRYFTEQWVLMGGLVLLGTVIVVNREDFRHMRWQPYAPALLLMLWLTLPLLLTLLLNERLPLYQPRRLSQIVPAIALLVAFGLWNLPRFGRHFLLIVIVVYSITHVDFWRFKQPWDAMATETASFIAPELPVFFELGGDDYAPRYHYGQMLPHSVDFLFQPPDARALLPDANTLVGLTTWRHLEPDAYAASLPPLLDSVDHLWLFYWSSDTGALDWLDAFGFQRSATITVDFNPDVYLYRYDRLPDDAPAMAQFANGMTLAETFIYPQKQLVDMLWTSDGAIDGDYTTSVVLLNAEGQVVAQRDSQPQFNQRPTSSWQANAIIYDGKVLQPVADTPLPAATYDVGVVVYRQVNGQLQRVPTTSGADTLIIGQMTLR